MNKSIPLLATTLIFAPVYAAGVSDSSQWKSSAELGYVATSGNTDTETLNAKAAASTERDVWRHSVEVTALNASDSGNTTARRFTLGGQSDYKLAAPSYLFVMASYEDDKFSGYDYRMTESIGYGRRVIDDSDLKLDLEIGPGARQSKPESGSSDNEGMIRAAGKLNWEVSETSKFAETLTIEAGEDATITKSVTSLTSQIEGNLSMKLSFTYKNTSEVPVGVDDTDTETAVTLVYSF